MPSPVVVQKQIGFVLKEGQAAKILVVEDGTGEILKETPVYSHAVYAKKERREDLVAYAALAGLALMIAVWGGKLFFGF